MDSSLIEIASAFLELRQISVDELRRVSVIRNWLVSSPFPMMWEVGAPYTIMLDEELSPPTALCPLYGVEEVSREARRSVLRQLLEPAKDLLISVIGSPTFVGVWGDDKWAFALWARDSIVVSLEETNYEEARVPFVVLAASSREQGDLSRGLTPRCYPPPWPE